MVTKLVYMLTWDLLNDLFTRNAIKFEIEREPVKNPVNHASYLTSEFF